MFTHIVFFKLKENTDENLQKAYSILKNMEGKIKELKSMEVGIDELKTDRSFDLALTTKFDSKIDYERYAISDFHVNEVLIKLRPMLESSKTVDYNL